MVGLAIRTQGHPLGMLGGPAPGLLGRGGRSLGRVRSFGISAGIGQLGRGMSAGAAPRAHTSQADEPAAAEGDGGETSTPKHSNSFNTTLRPPLPPRGSAPAWVDASLARHRLATDGWFNSAAPDVLSLLAAPGFG